MSTKSLGQHFLKNKSAIHKIVDALELAPDETVVEIGPGHGELTRQVALQLGSGQANGKWQMIAIEKDEKLFQQLGDARIENLKMMHGDALEILPDVISKFRNSEISKYKLLGNLPYYITGHLLRIVSELPENEKPDRCVFTIQKEVAERIVAKTPEMNRLAASVAYWADAKIVAVLPKEDFAPQPDVASAIIVLKRKKNPALPDAHRYYEALRTLFAQPRKTVLNNLAQHGAGTETNKEALSAKLRGLNIDPNSRPQDLHVENIAAIAGLLF